MTSPLKKMDRESWRSNTSFEDTHEIYAHCISSNTKRKNKWRQQFLAELSVLHHYIKGMTINTYIMKSNIQNFRDKYIIYSWYVTKFPSVSASVYLNRNMTMNYYTPTSSMDCNFVFLFFICVFFFVDLKEHEKDRCINI